MYQPRAEGVMDSKSVGRCPPATLDIVVSMRGQFFSLPGASGLRLDG